MTVRAVVAIVVVGIGAGTCAHHAPASDGDADSKLAASLRARGAWIDRLPLCDADATARAIDVGALTREAIGTVVTARGLLTLTANAVCTARACTSPCCNGCSVSWVVVPSPTAGGPPGREFAFMGSDGKSAPGLGAQDCQMDAIQAQRPYLEVVITGTPLGTLGDLITDATICRVAPAPKQQSRA